MTQSSKIAAGTIGIIVVSVLGGMAFSRSSELATMRGHSDVIRSIAYSNDGNLIASAGDDHMITLWNASTHSRQSQLEGHTKSVNGVAFADQQLVSASDDGSVRLWDIASGVCSSNFSLSKKPLESVAISLNGKVIAAGGVDEIVYVSSDRKTWKSLRGHTKTIRSVVFAPDGKTLASAGDDGVIRLWNVERGIASGTITVGGHRVHQLAFTDNGKVLACAITGGGVRSWDVPTLRERPKFDGLGQVRGLSFSADGLTLTTVHEDQTVQLWDVASMKQRRSMRGHDAPVLAVAMSPDTQFIASGGGDRVVKLWSAKD